MAKISKKMEGTQRLMAALVRMPPKQHEDMKVGKKRKSKRKKKPGK